ncbi:MAG: hypothetical protein ACPGFA_02500 [Pikeienuella sp.]
MALLALDILIFTVGNLVLIMEFKTTRDLERLFKTAALVMVISMALSYLARTSLNGDTLNWSLGGNGFMSVALFGPAAIFYVLRDTNVPEVVKWIFFAILIITGAVVPYLLRP